jgi:hypothetical protein
MATIPLDEVLEAFQDLLKITDFFITIFFSYGQDKIIISALSPFALQITTLLRFSSLT